MLFSVTLLFRHSIRNAGIFAAILHVGCSLLAPPDSALLGGTTTPPALGGTGGTAGSDGTGGLGGMLSGGAGTPSIPTTPPDPGSPPTVPSLDSLTLWLRADAGLDTASNRVTTWTSPMLEGSAAYSLRQEVPNQAPSLGRAFLGGRPLPSFDGVDDFLGNSEDRDFTGQDGYSLFLVLVPNTSESDGELLSIEGADINGGEAIRFGLWKVGAALEFGTTNRNQPRFITENVFVGGQPVMIEVVGSRSSEGEVVVSTYVNGVGEATGAGPTWDPEFELGFSLGARNASASGFVGAFAEVLIYKGQIGDAARYGTEAYLRAKWGCCHD